VAVRSDAEVQEASLACALAVLSPQATYFLLDTAVFFQKTKLLDTDGDALVLKTNRFWSVGLGLGIIVKVAGLVQVRLVHLVAGWCFKLPLAIRASGLCPCSRSVLA
jgi:hypothetical protein